MNIARPVDLYSSGPSGTYRAQAVQSAKDADPILQSHSYHREFHSKNGSHYLGDGTALGPIDLLHAFHSPTLGMRERADRLPWPDGVAVPVVHLEDLHRPKSTSLTLLGPKGRLANTSQIHCTIPQKRSLELRRAALQIFS